MVLALQSLRVSTSSTVVTCYDFFDCVFPECGLLDLTEGIYHGDPSTPYETAQRNQHEWLLDQAKCGPGSRVLDIGCGNGTLLEAAQRRGAAAVGITISPPQVARCRSRGLNVHLLDYRAIGDRWDGAFDAVIANGSAEHFVQPDDVLAGRVDAIYRDLFALCYRLLDPASPAQRFVTTIIHRNERTPRQKPHELLRGPWSFTPFSDKFHYALLQKGFGGFYPDFGQLRRCARDCFELIGEVDGTHDYHLTSEAAFRRAKQALVHWRTGPRIARRLAALMVTQPQQTLTLIVCLFVAESWQRQFRGRRPPTTLLRQTWQRR